MIIKFQLFGWRVILYSSEASTIADLASDLIHLRKKLKEICRNEEEFRKNWNDVYRIFCKQYGEDVMLQVIRYCKAEYSIDLIDMEGATKRPPLKKIYSCAGIPYFNE